MTRELFTDAGAWIALNDRGDNTTTWSRWISISGCYESVVPW